MSPEKPENGDSRQRGACLRSLPDDHENDWIGTGQET